MRPLISKITSVLCFSWLAACGSSGGGSDEAPNPAPAARLVEPSGGSKGSPRIVDGHFILAPEIPALEQNALAQDLNLIKSFNASLSTQENDEFRKKLGITGLDGASLYSWLRERLSYLIGRKLGNYKFALVYPSEQSYGYFKIGNTDDTIGESLTGAVNVGAGLFSYARELINFEKRDQYMRIEIGGKWVDVTTPRVGIMQIGPALFGVQVNPQKPGAFANSALRIETLFHEARHSDGNRISSSLGFTHIDCPSDRGVAAELVGKAACDSSSNGAYTVGAMILRSLYRNCGNRCTDREVEILKAYYLDNVSRVIAPASNGPSFLDPMPEPGIKATDISKFKLTNIQ